jgi:hypothetical protein
MKKTALIFLLIALSGLLLAGTALAAGDYQINWWTADSGGGSSQSTAGQYTLSGTIGQPETGAAAGGEYTFHGGFWQGIGAMIRAFLAHLPLVQR